MIAFIQRTPQERLEAFLEVSRVTRLDSISVEKDFWVCWTLRELFTLPGIDEHLTFKGGTSLSKAWKLIERFSEDIDLIVDKEVLGFGGDAAPDKAPSNKQRRVRLEALMGACREWVQGRLMPGLTERIHAALGDTGWKIEIDPDMPDGQCLLFHYPSVFPTSSASYVRPVVKIELGARSDDWPHEEKTILPYVIETFPAFAPGAAFEVRVLAAERTFWEKACLLHEETFRPTESRESSAWPAITTISGASSVPGSATAPSQTPLSLRAWPSTVKFSFVTPGWTTPRTNPAPSASRLPPSTSPTGVPITKRCSGRCSLVKPPPSSK